MIFTPTSSAYSQLSNQTGQRPGTAPLVQLQAYRDQPARLDGTIYGRLQNLPINPLPENRTVVYTDRAASIISNFEQSFRGPGGGINN